MIVSGGRDLSVSKAVLKKMHKAAPRASFINLPRACHAGMIGERVAVRPARINHAGAASFVSFPPIPRLCGCERPRRSICKPSVVELHVIALITTPYQVGWMGVVEAHRVSASGLDKRW